MADGFLDDAKEWLSYAEADLGVATYLLNIITLNLLKSYVFTVSRRLKKRLKH